MRLSDVHWEEHEVFAKDIDLLSFGPAPNAFVVVAILAQFCEEERVVEEDAWKMRGISLGAILETLRHHLDMKVDNLSVTMRFDVVEHVATLPHR